MIYSENQKKIRDACGRICFTVGQKPNAIAPEKYRSWALGYLKDNEPVRAWMLWLPTMLIANDRRNQPSVEDQLKIERREYIARMIEESNPGQDPRYKYHTQKY